MSGSLSIKDFDSITGYLSETDKKCLQKYSERTSCLIGDFLEIGSYYGLSSLCLLSRIPSLKKLYTIDINVRNSLKENLSSFGFSEKVQILHGNFIDIGPFLSEKIFCLEFLITVTLMMIQKNV